MKYKDLMLSTELVVCKSVNIEVKTRPHARWSEKVYLL